MILNINHLKSVLGLITGHYYVKAPVKFVIVLCNNSSWKGQMYAYALYYEVMFPLTEHYWYSKR